MADTVDNFVHLHVHSEYSLLDGLGRIKNLVKEAKRLGQPALALTDHGVMHGAIEFFRACKEGGIKPLIGVESYQTTYGRPMGGRDSQFDKDYYHLLLLAKDMTGYHNLLKIATQSQLEGYYYKPRVDHDFLAKHSAGLIASTGCLGAEVPNLLLQGKEREAYERLGWYVDIFGKENFFVEIQEHSIPELIPVNKQLIPWADKFGLQLVVTNDVHYVRAEDGLPHEVLLCVQTGNTMDSPKRMKLSDHSYFVKSRAQMEETFRPLFDLPSSAYDHTLQIMEMCNVDLEDPTYHLPDLPIPEGHTYDTYIRELTEDGMARLYGERAQSDALQERKERELRVIAQMGFSVYFLIVSDLCRFARTRNIWWNVRGSGAGSLVAYCIGITGLDPLKNNLIFERFLNPGRVSMPDFDMDFPDDQREEMIRYTVEKYGEDRVAQIATFNRMKAKAAVRDVGRAQGIELAKVDRLAKLIPGIPGKPVTIQDCLTEGHEFYSAELVQMYQTEEWVKHLLDTAQRLEGVARNPGVHAAAVIVSDRELSHYTPLMRGSKTTVTSTIAQYEFPILESIGLLKVDFLGLSTLSVMREAGKLIKARHGIELNLQNIPFEGEPAKEAFKLLSSGEVSGVFQVESEGMRRVLTQMKPTMFEHIIAMISLYRPGPIEYIPQFIRRMHGEEPVEYKHPELESILAETYGICVSGDALVIDARTGRRCRLDELDNDEAFLIQGVDEHWQPATGQVTHWIDNGVKPVYRVTLRNGASIKVTGDHRLLTEQGWQPLNTLAIGDHIATPAKLIGPDEAIALQVDRRKLRVLAYLIADGSLASMASVDFVSKDQPMVNEYVRCLAVFEDLRPVFTTQVREVIRVGVAKLEDTTLHYHTPTSLLQWIRSLGLKHPAGSRPGGLRSEEKFVPPFVFELSDSDIAWFLASLWDCDGYMGRKLCHYKTISKQLAEDVQTLLLRLGIRSTIHTAQYVNRPGENEEQRTSYQVTVYDTQRLAESLQPFMISIKKNVICQGRSATTIDRTAFLSEVATVTSLSARGLMDAYGIDRQHFYAKRQKLARISAQVVTPLTGFLPLPLTSRKLGIDWQAIVQIEPAGEERVYDLTVEGLHNFVADNIIVHNCVYQEQIIQILSKLAGYTPGEADLVRRAVSKKKASDIEKHKKLFIAGCTKNNIDEEAASAIYGDIEFFARYGFNKSHAADYAVITVQTAYLKAHYPVEYMAAQLLVERDKTEKVTNFITECRRMGIDVLPPDVNYSGLDFEIQLRPPDTAKTAQRDPSIAYNFPIPEGSAIRFGMAAIKNVGEGPVQVIRTARQDGGTFANLEDFCDRVDLRQVNKRAMECLIKAGCFDNYGERNALLAVIELMVASSAGVHDSRDTGQLSIFDLFGGDGGANKAQAAAIKLPAVEPAKGKEKLQWEKELLGVYSISHPLNNFGAKLQKVVTCSCSELDERYDGKTVVLGGMISGIRTITTKKGDPMAFVQLEDLQGSCEVVFFPKTYAELKDKLLPDQVLIIYGKAQAREGKTSLLADGIKSHIDEATAVNSETPAAIQKPLIDAGPTFNGQINDNDSGIDDFMPSAESSPFASDMPTWINDAPPLSLDDDGDPDGEDTAPPVLNGLVRVRPDMPPAPKLATQAPPTSAAPATVKAPPPPSVAKPSAPPARTASIPVKSTLPPVTTKPAVSPPAVASAKPAPAAKPKSLPEPSAVWYDFDARADKKAAEEEEEARLQESKAAAERAAALPPEVAQPDEVLLASNSSDKGDDPLLPDAVEEADHADLESTKAAEEEIGHRRPQTVANGRVNGHNGNGHYANGNGNGNGNGRNEKFRLLRISLRRTGDLERDKYRLKQIYDAVLDPRGRDHFVIRLLGDGQNAELAFPNDGCTINEKLLGELTKHLRVEVAVEE